MINPKILEYAYKENGEKQAWFGKQPQFDMDIIDIQACSNYRLPSKFHGIYDTVWIYEKALHEYNILSWKIVLDEAIRLLKQNGKLILRLANKKEFSIPMIKNFIGRHSNLKVTIDNEFQGNNSIIVFNIERLNFDIYKNNTWTFAMLTNGKKDDVVIKFLESIRSNELNKSQIIISGPQKDIYDNYDVEYLDLTKYRDNEYAEISRKKDDIAKIARNENIMIVHDRFYLDKNFFKNFEEYGYDFDFLAVRQETNDGRKLPYYCAIYEPNLAWGKPVDVQNSEILPRTAYVNGGCLVFKTKTLQKIGFNKLLFWNQMEDVEITQTFISDSIIPRINFLSCVIGDDDNSERMEANFNFDILKGYKIKKQKDSPKETILYGINDRSHFPLSIKIGHKSKFPFISIRIKAHVNGEKIK